MQIKERAEERHMLQQELNHTQEQLGQATQELDQARQELRTRENTLKELMDDLLPSLQRQTPDRSSDERIRQQIRAEEQRRAQDQAWTRWLERRRENLQEREQSLQDALQRKQSPRGVQVREGQQQRLQRLRDILRDNQGSQQIQLPREILHGVLQDERRLQQELQAGERRLQGERIAVREELEGLPHELLREQLRQRVDDVLRGQPAREQLRHQILELRSAVLNDYRELEPQQNRLSAEFQDILEERWRYHGHPEQDLRIILGYLTGRGPER